MTTKSHADTGALALTTAAPRQGLVLEYRLRDDVDLAGYLGEVAAFARSIRALRSDNAYTSYQTEEDPRSFVHLGDFAADAVAALRGEAFFRAFTASLRERCVAPPSARTLRPVSRR